MSIFHLAIPSHDLDAATAFYTAMFDARPARRYADRQTFDFFGHQLVCHLDRSLDVPGDPLEHPYPRHFGVTVLEREEIEEAYDTYRERGAAHLSALNWRFKGKHEEHLTFWTADPSGNVLEFKWYADPAQIY